MERAMILLLALLAFPARAATPTTIGIVTNTAYTGNGSGLIPLESISGTGTTGIFSISAGDYNNSLAAADFYPFYKNGTAYQVSSGKTAYCFNMTGLGSLTNGGIQIVSASNPIAFTSAALTGVASYQMGAAAKYSMAFGVPNVVLPIPGTYQFSQNYYPGIQVDTSNAYIVKMDCYEK